MPPHKARILAEALTNYYSVDRNPEARENYWDEFTDPGLELCFDKHGPRFEGSAGSASSASSANKALQAIVATVAPSHPSTRPPHSAQTPAPTPTQLSASPNERK